MELDGYSISDLAWRLVPYYGEKVRQKTPSDIMRSDRFTMSSTVSQRSYTIVENYFYERFSDIDFVELSPLQPLGLNSVLANTNGKKIIPTIRGQEVNSDATTALFLEGYRRFSANNIGDIRLATNVRTVRPKVFAPETKFLPHFKVFAEVSIGRQGAPYGQKEIDLIAKHLVDELETLIAIRRDLPNHITNFNVYISDLVLLRNLLQTTQQKVEPIFNSVIEANAIWQKTHLPEYLPFDSTLVESLMKLGFHKGLKILEMFYDSLTTRVSNLQGVNFLFDLSRSAGMEYYRHIAYKITAVENHGTELPLADGGSNDWAVKISNNKQYYTVSSGVGTELLIQNYLGPLL